MKKVYLLVLLLSLFEVSLAQQPSPGKITPASGCEYSGGIVSLKHNNDTTTTVINGQNYSATVYLSDDIHPCQGYIMVSLVAGSYSMELGEVTDVNDGTFTIPFIIDNVPAGVYTLQYSFTTGAATMLLDVDTVKVLVSTGMQNVSSNNNISVYPLPASDQLNIDLANAVERIEAISLKDMNGRTVKTIAPAVTSSIQIPVSDLPAGMYIMQLQSSERVFYRKVVINH